MQGGKMVSSLAMVAAIALTAQGQPAGEKPPKECCDTKTVGGVTYTLVGRMDTQMYNCMSDCIYQKEGMGGAKFCFAIGDQKVECNDEEMGGSERPPMEGSERPPMEGSERPPMEGSERPPMEGSERPPMEGSERPPMEGSEKPPMEGSEKPPVGEGSSQAPGATTSAGGCKCGVKRTTRIVGGSETEINEYPWMVSVADAGESQFCGGTLIASQWVLTAAHCMFHDTAGTQPKTAAELLAVLGEHDNQDTTESKIPKKAVKVSEIINHADYSADTSNNDIALLKLAEEVDMSVYAPACLPSTADNFEGKNAWVYGWGSLEYGGQYPSKLMEVEVPVVSNTVCQTAMPEFSITDAMLCAGGQLNKDGCQGDSGGPLTVDVAGKHVLIGDVSFGNQCGLEGKYGVYGDVAFFRTWIDTKASGAKYCPA
jgi:hypothetical protein